MSSSKRYDHCDDRISSHSGKKVRTSQSRYGTKWNKNSDNDDGVAQGILTLVRSDEDTHGANNKEENDNDVCDNDITAATLRDVEVNCSTNNIGSINDNYGASQNISTLSTEAAIIENNYVSVDLSSWIEPNLPVRPLVEFFGPHLSEENANSVETVDVVENVLRSEVQRHQIVVGVEDVVLMDHDDERRESTERVAVESTERVAVASAIVHHNDFSLEESRRSPVSARYPWLTNKLLTVIVLSIVIPSSLIIFLLTMTTSLSQARAPPQPKLPTVAPFKHSSSVPSRETSEVAWVEVTFNSSFSSDDKRCCNVALSDDGNVLFIANRGIIRTYDLMISGGAGVWSHEDNIPLHLDSFAQISISSDGSYLVTGNMLYERDTGVALVFHNHFEYSWQRVGQEIVGENQGDMFGTSVAITDDGGTIAVGARFGSYVKVYAKRNEMWGLNQRLEFRSTSFGRAVAITSDGSRLIMSAPAVNRNGVIYVYELATGAFIQRIYGSSEEMILGDSIGLSSGGNKLAFLLRINVLYGVKVYNFETTTKKYIQVGDTIEFPNCFVAPFPENIAFSADGSRVAAGFSCKSAVMNLFLLSVKENDVKIIGDITEETTDVDYASTFVDISRTGKLVAIGILGGKDRKVKVYELF